MFCLVNVGTNSDQFIIEVHHGGFFVGQGLNRAYVDEKVNWFDYCEVDSWSPLWIDDFVEQLHYQKNEALKVYWLLPGRDLSDGLRVVSSDSDTLVMVSVVNKVKNYVLYLDHDDNITGINWDDIVANPTTLPKVMSPQKVQSVGNKQSEKLPDFCANLNSRTDDVVEPHTTTESGLGNCSEEDPEFVDSDNELEDDDDDLFDDHVDEEVVDEGVAKGKSIVKAKEKGVAEDEDDVSADEDDLQLPDSDGENEVWMGFKLFRVWVNRY